MSSHPQIHALKCVIVGDHGVGKTCLVFTHFGGKFPHEYIPTLLGNEQMHMKYGKKVVGITVYDTAGQSDYDRLRPLSYPQTDVFVICFSINSRESFDNISSKWIPEISHHCPGCRYLIVGLKDDLRKYQIWSDIPKLHQLTTVYCSVYGQSKDGVFPLDIIVIIVKYLKDNKQYVSDDEAEELCAKMRETGGEYPKYLSCSAIELRGLKEIFMEVCKCNFGPMSKKNSCNIL